jgi:hypothetical protein
MKKENIKPVEVSASPNVTIKSFLGEFPIDPGYRWSEENNAWYHIDEVKEDHQKKVVKK